MKYDVYAYGMISTSTLHVLKQNYPEADAYAEIKESYAMIGGEAANSSIVLSKLGLKVLIDGNWLGKDENGRQVIKLLKDFKIDNRKLNLKKDYTGVKEIVFTDGLTRTNFGSYQQLLFTTKQWNDPDRRDIEKAKLICLDPFFHEASLYVADQCKDLAKPCVTIDVKFSDKIAQYASVIIISGEFRKREYRDIEPLNLFREYTKTTKALIIFTFGEQPVLYGRTGEEIKQVNPVKIEPVDTTGAGDAFRSGVIFGLLQNWPEDKIINFACGLSAYICESFPGVLHCPDNKQLMTYLCEKNIKI